MSVQPEKTGQAYNELKRLFGDDNVQEEITSPPHFGVVGSKAPEEWCYVVTLTPENPLFSRHPDSNSDFRQMVTDIEWLLTDRLSLHQLLNSDMGMGIEQHFSQQYAVEPQRLIFKISDIENEQDVSILKNISHEAIRNVLNHENHKDIHAKHSHLLRRASHGLRWEFKSDQEGEYYQTTRKLNAPQSLEVAITHALGYTGAALPPKDGKARVSFEALSTGNLPKLMETIVPEKACSMGSFTRQRSERPLPSPSRL